MIDKMSHRQSVTYENHAVSDDHSCTNIKTAYCITRTRTREKILDKKCGYLWVQKACLALEGCCQKAVLEDCCQRAVLEDCCLQID